MEKKLGSYTRRLGERQTFQMVLLNLKIMSSADEKGALKVKEHCVVRIALRPQVSRRTSDVQRGAR